MTERHHPAEAHEQIEGRREKTGNGDLREQLQKEWRECERSENQRSDRHKQRSTCHQCSSGRPSSPHGRTINTIAITANRSTIEIEGNIRIPKDCSRPTNSALMKLPAKLPSPPTTTTTKAFVSTSLSMPSATATVGAASAPPKPASQLPNMNT